MKVTLPEPEIVTRKGKPVSVIRHLLDMDDDALLLAFNAAGLSPVHAVHPKRLLRALR